MNVKYSFHNIAFEWDSQKATANLRKHSITFELACEAFFDPFVCYPDDETIDGELREAIMGLSTNWQLLYVVYSITVQHLHRARKSFASGICIFRMDTKRDFSEARFPSD